MNQSNYQQQSERPPRREGGRGGSDRGRNFRGKNQRSRGGPSHQDQQVKKQRTSAIDLTKYIDKEINVKFAGGREISGILKGADPLLNMVLDQATETLRIELDQETQTIRKRAVGLVVCRGPSVFTISPLEGHEEIENPFFEATE
ncbi:hypothetical protein BB560_001416 [Smittium megazygosporum]|uniref:Sm domain-containing protein n=1 Tax=Smittium megazygosporum TaxID=133381 RepID=A0A2T9ZHL2_9FUNG|nr:hypothetical protein BB560_001416 [Smittium megazygosporum]